MPTSDKAEGAFRTIGELAKELGLPQHILRYWETRFPQLRPLQRAGNRRYYRPDDVALARRIDTLLNKEGYTVRGVQQLLRREGGAEAAAPDAAPTPAPVPAPAARPAPTSNRAALQAIRDVLASALIDDARMTM
jgi:DNA-binding transcriptional MerR regulator